MHFMALMNCGKEIIFRFQNKGKKSFSLSKSYKLYESIFKFFKRSYHNGELYR